MTMSHAEQRQALLDKARHLRSSSGDAYHDRVTEAMYAEASRIAANVVTKDQSAQGHKLDTSIDSLVTSKRFGFPFMIAILSIVLWLTIEGANVPSSLLASLLIDTLQPIIKNACAAIMPLWAAGFLIDGVYLGMAWVISVMLPPMAIFFPLFTLLEDFGYLPRVAFNLDKIFRRAGAHGKQALTMCMGFGCNAAGVVATRIIDSPRERLLAIITNNFSLCNGRWPTQILIASIFLGALVPPAFAGIVAASGVLFIALLGIFFTFATSYLLSRTWLKGEVSAFSLELPPYRPPRFWQTMYTSLIDRTLIVLMRAVVFAAPCGGVIWLLGNVQVSGLSLAEHLIHAFDGFGWLIGLNGVILLAYLIAIPANEIVIPTVLMLTVLMTKATGIGAGAGVMFELDSDAAVGNLLRGAGWTALTGFNLMLFSLLHNPCSTTIYTIYRETKSARWTIVASLLPVAMGVIACFVVAQLWRLVNP